MSQSIYKLVYVSSATIPFTQKEMFALLEKSRQNNFLLDVTGILLFYENNFFQLLEGEKEIVETLYKRILDDPRHRGALRIFSETTSCREFPEWSMGFKLIDHSWDMEFREGLNDVLKDGRLDLNGKVVNGVSVKVHKLLETFKQISGIVSV